MRPVPALCRTWGLRGSQGLLPGTRLRTRLWTVQATVRPVLRHQGVVPLLPL